ncbi:MAG: hypothetical protein H0U76_06905 [Ktedonobacteraceae bacterium]|nr:hypothetical protein [Ktedonobacteraceae bacterium]
MMTAIFATPVRRHTSNAAEYDRRLRLLSVTYRGGWAARSRPLPAPPDCQRPDPRRRRRP